MKHTLSLYNFHNNDIRVIEIDGEPWFAVKDVCSVLALNNPSQALKANCKERNQASIPKSNLISNEVSFPNRGMSCVNEAGLYELIFASRKPEARAFKDWVTSVVLPAIRKDGMYVAGEEKMATGEMDEDELTLMVMENLRKKIARAKEENRAMRKVLETCSLQRYFGLNDIFPTPSERGKLSTQARRMAEKEGVVLEKEARIVFRDGQEIPTQVNLYPRDLLDRAAAHIGLFDAHGSQPRPIHRGVA